MKTSRIIGALLVLASAAGCEREAAPTAPRMASNAATGNADGRIAFTSDRDLHYLFTEANTLSGSEWEPLVL